MTTFTEFLEESAATLQTVVERAIRTKAIKYKRDNKNTYTIFVLGEDGAYYLTVYNDGRISLGRKNVRGFLQTGKLSVNPSDKEVFPFLEKMEADEKERKTEAA